MGLYVVYHQLAGMLNAVWFVSFSNPSLKQHPCRVLLSIPLGLSPPPLGKKFGERNFV